MAEPFRDALKRYIAGGYRAPDAMRAVWHDVRIGRVERPRKPGRKYRQAVAGIPGRPLYNPVIRLARCLRVGQCVRLSSRSTRAIRSQKSSGA